jgi:hypothetical protein
MHYVVTSIVYYNTRTELLGISKANDSDVTVSVSKGRAVYKRQIEIHFARLEFIHR